MFVPIHCRFFVAVLASCCNHDHQRSPKVTETDLVINDLSPHYSLTCTAPDGSFSSGEICYHYALQLRSDRSKTRFSPFLGLLSLPVRSLSDFRVLRRFLVIIVSTERMPFDQNLFISLRIRASILQVTLGCESRRTVKSFYRMPIPLSVRLHIMRHMP